VMNPQNEYTTESASAAYVVHSSLVGTSSSNSPQTQQRSCQRLRPQSRPRFTTKVSKIKKRLRTHAGAYYPLSALLPLVEFVPGTKYVQFLNDQNEEPLRFKVLNHAELGDVVVGTFLPDNCSSVGHIKRKLGNCKQLHHINRRRNQNQKRKSAATTHTNNPRPSKKRRVTPKRATRVPTLPTPSPDKLAALTNLSHRQVKNNSWARPDFPPSPTASWVHPEKGNVAPGVWSRPEVSSEDTRVISQCLSVIHQTSCAMYQTPRDSVTFLEYDLWEIPWSDIRESRRNEKQISLRVRTSVCWVTRNRVKYNKSKEDSRQWSSRLGTHLNEFLSDEDYYTCFYVLPKKELLIQWQEGYTILDVKRDAIPVEIHDQTNNVLTQLFRAAANGQQNRRDAARANPAPIHAGIHEYRGIPAQLREPYSGHGTAVRFFQDVPNPGMFLQLTPLHAWSNKYYAESDPKWWQKMDQDNRRKDITVGGKEKQLNTHHLTWKNTNVHADTEPWPSLLTYYSGPPEAPWTKGGEVHIPELRVWVVTKPRTTGLIDGRLYHYASEVMGVRHCVSSYRSEISPNAYFHEDFSWINTENFGFNMSAV